MPELKLYIHTDGTIRVNGLKDEDTLAVINSATITLSIFKETPIYIEQSKLTFTSGGSYEIVVGDIIKGATGNAVAYVTAITLTAGSWASGTAVGILWLKNQIGTFQSEELNLENGTQTGIATIAGDSTGAESVAAGADTKLTIPNHGLDTNDFIYIEGSGNYEGQKDVKVQDAWNKLTIDDAYVLEKFLGTEKVFIGLRNAKSISLTSTGSGGNYKGTLPDSVKKLIKDSFYHVRWFIVYGTFNIMIVKRWEAEYYEGGSS